MENKVIIIAEAGVNHNGDIQNAIQLINVAKEAGADYVKFQTFKTENLVSKDAQKADYQKQNTGNDDSQFNMLKQLELSIEDHYTLINHCNKIGIKFFSTGFDLESITFLKSLNLGLWKIPSGEITNKPYLQKIGSYNEPTILSTGMSEMSEVEDAINVLLKSGLPKEKITVLHCTSDYPTENKDVNLLAMKSMKDKFGLKVGYSDHTLGNDVAIGAVCLGATILEKHFTLDKEMPGPDHKASLTPDELKSYISSIRNIEMALGSPEKKPTIKEMKTRNVARKSLHLNRNMKAGETLSIDDITIVRPGDGMSPMLLDEVVGKVMKRDLEIGSQISNEDLL